MDAVKNFAKVTVSTGYDAAATSIALQSGDGARLPAPSTDGAFNLVWWNSTDYADPSDDPNKEIVRCTARSTDTLTVTRAQEGTVATTKNTASKTYKMILALTKKMVDDLQAKVTEAEFTASIAHATGDAGAGKAFTVTGFPLHGVIKKIKARADFTACQQTAASALVNNASGIAPADTSIAYDNVSGSFSIGDYIWIDNECMYVSAVGTPFTVTRAQKGTIAGYHDDNSQIVKANNGLRLVLYKDSNKKEVEKVIELNSLMTYKGVTDAAITAGDKLFGLTADIKNVDKDDIIYIDDTTPEEAIVQNVNHDVVSATYDFTVFVKGALAAHTITNDVYKQIVYDIPTPYKSATTTLYGTLFVDEKISATVNCSLVITTDKYA